MEEHPQQDPGAEQPVPDELVDPSPVVDSPHDDVEGEPPLHPRIYVADLASAARHIQHGLWIDAHQEPAALDADIEAMLDSSPTVGAKVWAVHDTEQFADVDLSDVRDTTLIATLAEGVTRHGRAFGAWARAIDNDPEQLDQFSERYTGSYPSAEVWARELAEALGWQEAVDRGITDPLLKPYVVIDYAAMIHDASASWHVISDSDGTTHVFVR